MEQGGPESGVSRRPGAGGGVTVGFVARATLVVLALWGLANVVWLARDVFFVAFFALLVAAFLSVFVDPLERVGVPRPLAAILVLLLTLGLLAGLVWLTWPTLQSQLGLIRQQLPQAVGEAGAWLESQYRLVTGEFGRPDPELARQVRARLRSEAAELISGAVPLLNTVVGALAGLLVVVFAGLYLAIESRLYVRGAALLVPRGGRDRLMDALQGTGETLRRWMVATVVGMVLIGTLTAVGLWLLGIPAALALGVIAGLLEFIPIVGPILSAVPAMAVALILSPAQAVWVALLYIAIQQLESNLIMPLVMKGVVELPPALTVLFQAMMAILFGFLGLLLAVPILAATMALVKRLYVEEVTEAPSAE